MSWKPLCSGAGEQGQNEGDERRKKLWAKLSSLHFFREVGKHRRGRTFGD